MVYTELTKKALQIMFEAHKNQVDKAGVPYVFHPYEVASHMDDEISTCVALLHDVAEDSDMTLDQLSAVFPPVVMDALRAITHTPGEPYLDVYIPRVKQNAVAAKVKLADLQHNSDLTRLSEVDEKAQRRVAKYQKAIQILSK